MGRERAHVCVTQNHLPAGEAAADSAQERGFAGPIWSHQGGHLTGAEGDAVDGDVRRRVGGGTKVTQRVGVEVRDGAGHRFGDASHSENARGQEHQERQKNQDCCKIIGIGGVGFPGQINANRHGAGRARQRTSESEGGAELAEGANKRQAGASHDRRSQGGQRDPPQHLPRGHANARGRVEHLPVDLA